MIDLNSFLETLFRYCDENNRPCLLARSYTPTQLVQDHRDVDILLRKEHVGEIIHFIRGMSHIKLVGLIHHPNNTQLYLYGIQQASSPFLCLDIHHKLALNGLDYLSVNAVMLRKEPLAETPFYQPQPLDQAFIYLFSHVLKHATISEKAYHALTQVMKDERLAFQESLLLYFGPQGKKWLDSVLDEKDPFAARCLKSLFMKKNWQANMIGTAMAVLLEKSYILWQRLFVSRDVRIALMGTDGAGKTTLARTLTDRLHNLRPRIVHTHLLPVMPWQKQPDSSKTNSNPHRLPRRDWVTSNLKIIYYFLLYWLDALWPYRSSRLIIYDRYMIDILVDPLRFRFGGSIRLAGVLVRLLPSVHAYIWVSTPPSIAYGRKPEVPLPVMTHQYDAYKQLVTTLPDAIVFNVAGDVNALVETLVGKLDVMLEKQC